MSHLKEMLQNLSDLKLKAEYWDVRVEDAFETQISVSNGETITCTASPSVGAFIRVRKNGFWFYESTTELAELKNILQKLDQQENLATATHVFAPVKQPAFSSIASHENRLSAVSMERKLNLVQAYEEVVRNYPQSTASFVIYKDIYKVKSFLNSVGTQFEFDFNQAGFACRYTLKDGELLFEDTVHHYGAKFSELENQQDLIKKCMKESARFLHAPSIAPGKYNILFDPEVTGVFTHESFGHSSEADFMIGNEQALQDWSLGKKIASDCLSIVDNGNHPGTSGYCPIDDDGTPAQKNYLIKDGILTGRLHSLETAAQLGEKPTGNSRAMSFEWEPMVRMTSTYIEPGKEKIEDILKKAEGAILVEGVKHGSGLSTFTIAPQRGYRIGKNGEREPVRVAVLSGSVFETLKNIEAVSSDFQLHSSSIGGCGKMDQMPLPVSDGGPFILVKDMQVS